MQAFPRVSLEQRFFSRKIEAFLARFLVKPLLAFPENLCSAMPSLRLSESSSTYTRNSTSSAGGGPPTVSTLLTQFAHSGYKCTLCCMAIICFANLQYGRISCFLV